MKRWAPAAVLVLLTLLALRWLPGGSIGEPETAALPTPTPLSRLDQLRSATPSAGIKELEGLAREALTPAPTATPAERNLAPAAGGDIIWCDPAGPVYLCR